MKDIMKNAANQEKIAALRLAEIKATDREDLINCANDISKGASLDQSEALEIAKAIRAKYLPNLAKQAGISDIGVKKLLNFDNGAEQTADFVDESDDDMNEDMHHLEDDEDEFDNDIQEDNDEVEDNDDIAKIVIEVPADMVDAAQKAVQEALDNLLGGEDSDFDMEDDDMDFIGRYKVNRLIANNEFDSEDSLKSAIVDALVNTYPNKKITFDYYFNNNDEIVKRYDESA
jgi:hypothetical protein